MFCEIDIIKQGYMKGFIEGRSQRPVGSGPACAYHEFGGADCFMQGYKAGYRRGSGKIQSEGKLQDTAMKYFYKDFANEIDVQVKLALRLNIPAGEKESVK